MKPGYLLATGERVANEDVYERVRAVVPASRLPPHLLWSTDDDLVVRAAIGCGVGDPWQHEEVVVVLDEGAYLRAVRAMPVLSTARPYVGVTGFGSAEEVWGVAPHAVVHCAQIDRRFMGGVLVSAKTLRGEATESLRYPSIDDAERVLEALGAAGAWPVAHFNTHATGVELTEEVAALLRALPSARGVQLNVPDLTREAVESLRRAHPSIEFIAQVRASKPGDILRATDDLRWVDYVLCDASQGQGKALDLDVVGRVLRDAQRYGGALPNFAVAGGLGPSSVDTLYDLAVLAAPREVSFDAEGQLRVPVEGADASRKHQDRLDVMAACRFVSGAVWAIAQARWRWRGCSEPNGRALCAVLRSMVHGEAAEWGEHPGAEERAWAIFAVPRDRAPKHAQGLGDTVWRVTVVADATTWGHVPEHLESLLDGHAVARLGWRRWALLSTFEATREGALERVASLCELAARGPGTSGGRAPQPSLAPLDADLADAWQRGAAATREAILAALTAQAETSERIGAYASALTVRHDVATVRAVPLPPYRPKGLRA